MRWNLLRTFVLRTFRGGVDPESQFSIFSTRKMLIARIRSRVAVRVRIFRCLRVPLAILIHSLLAPELTLLF